MNFADMISIKTLSSNAKQLAQAPSIPETGVANKLFKRALVEITAKTSVINSAKDLAGSSHGLQSMQSSDKRFPLQSIKAFLVGTPNSSTSSVFGQDPASETDSEKVSQLLLMLEDEVKKVLAGLFEQVENLSKGEPVQDANHGAESSDGQASEMVLITEEVVKFLQIAQVQLLLGSISSEGHNGNSELPATSIDPEIEGKLMASLQKLLEKVNGANLIVANNALEEGVPEELPMLSRLKELLVGRLVIEPKSPNQSGQAGEINSIQQTGQTNSMQQIGQPQVTLKQLIDKLLAESQGPVVKSNVEDTSTDSEPPKLPKENHLLIKAEPAKVAKDSADANKSLPINNGLDEEALSTKVEVKDLKVPQGNESKERLADAMPRSEGVMVNTLPKEGVSEVKTFLNLDKEINFKGQAQGVPAKEVFRQVIERAHLLTNGNENIMRIQLKPEHLGKVAIEISVENGIVKAQFAAESQQVRQLLEGNLTNLRHSLVAQGFKIDEVSVATRSEFFWQQNQERSQQASDFKSGRKARENEGNLGISTSEELVIERPEYGSSLLDRELQINYRA